ncbi:hypothetical protein ACTJKO_17250 [Curtobacterium sp. 22159]|uniref:hypothetical protein n=1 Tax=Curtobacterium sp. 22159 TaxID=3453882 RepID=UPI003F857F5B
MPHRLEWTHDTVDHWEARIGSTTICDVTRTDHFTVDSPGHAISGEHSSFESAVSQVQAWVRWSSAHPD